MKTYLLNLLDFRYWFCPCFYAHPYGLVTSADCKKHDGTWLGLGTGLKKAIAEYKELKAKQ
jgi:hypothetical protein